jgi:predicted unusual protein kinase regulating ubiquinone biosynthesis (AarF/ABC1/UbiB family)
VIGELPRRPFLEPTTGETSLGQMRLVSFETSRTRALRRLLTWFRLLFSFALTTVIDILMRRDSPERRAARLRQAFERIGGSFVTLGRHLSTRVDFMPWAYCGELSTMPDRMAPFPVRDAIAVIERSTGRPLAATFGQFDPNPILSSSIACTYQAVLRSGAKVTVKVRRPGIGAQFMADMKAFDWLMTLAEILTIFRRGFTRGMRTEFHDLLLEELDFVQEARRQDSFRRAAADSRKTWFSAPRIHLDLSGEEIVVSAFASGMWMWELLAAVEQGNETVLAQARALNIDPRKVARRLLWVNYWAWSENLFFHAEPHANNIILARDSTLFFIDFASTGTLSRPKRQALRQNLQYAWDRDPLSMARSSLILLEPLPPVDPIELSQELESYNWQLLYDLEADPHNLTWQERTSATQWIGLIRMARKHGIVIDIQVLRLMRATLLLESLAVRLDPEINYVERYRKFNGYRAEQARRRVTDAITGGFEEGNSEQLVVRLNSVAQTFQGLYFRLRHTLTMPTVNFGTFAGKWAFAFYILLRFLGQVFLLTGVGVLLAALLTVGEPLDLPALLQVVTANFFYRAAVIALIFVNARLVLFRFDDKDVQDSR